MVTLISAGNSDGEYGRCDAKCYNATGGKCDCICGGRNHGVGLQQATENTRDQVDEMIDETRQRTGQDLKFDLAESVRQISIFEK